MSIVMCNFSLFQDIFWLLGVENVVEFELLLNNKRTTSLCSCSMQPNEDKDEVLKSSAIETISDFLQVSLAIYQADLYFLTMPLLVNAVNRACSTGRKLRLSSEPPAASPNRPARKRYGDAAIYEIIDSTNFLLRCMIELRTEQSPCPLKSILIEAHNAMSNRKASSVLLVIGVSTRSLAVRVAEVNLNEDVLEISKYVEFSLTNRRTLAINKFEATQFVFQISQWLIEHEDD